jgi:tellurite resistance protein TehA-like permease
MPILHSLTDHASPAGIALRNFTSQWFLIPQGTGIIAVILHQLDYQFDGLVIISEIFWVLTIVVLVVMLLAYTLRAMAFPGELATALSSNTSETSCLASISITFTTIIQMIELNLVHEWGHGWGLAAYVLWWINTAMAVICCIGIPYVFVKYEPPGLSGLTPTTNLPLIAALTAAAGGGVLCRYGALSDSEQMPVIIVSYLLIGIALPLALGFDTVFLTRLLNKSSPKGMQLYQDMILCGPWGQGGFALMILGSDVLRGTFSENSRGIFLTSQAAKPVGYASIFGGLLAWGHGTFWWAFAIVSIFHSAFDKRKHWRGLSFGLPAWSVVFPWVST